MSYLALARRYRPGDFESILSQHHVTKTLQNAIKSGRISHAYLFCGPRGTGKTTTARVLARALNCEKGPTPEPCGICTVCKEIALGSSPDVFEIDAASNRGIDDIRELRENVRYSPVAGRYKVYIIDEVHRLTKEAFDALLKTLEEPPSHVIFIFATTDPQALPATILSRTQRYDFKRIPVSGLAEAVNSVAEKEGIKILPGAALLIAKKADGSLRDALSLLDQLSSFADGPIDEAQTADVLGLVKTELLAQLSEAIVKRDVKKSLDIFGEFSKSGGDAQELSDSLTGYMRTLLLVKSGVSDTEVLELDVTEIANAKAIVTDIDTVDLLRYFTILADYKGSVKQGQDPVYSFEAALVKMATMDRAISLESLLNKIPNTPVPKSPTPVPARVAKKADSEPKRGSNTTTDPEATQPIHTPEPISGSNITAAIPISGECINIDYLTDNWGGFCDLIKKSRMSLFAHLGVCSLSKIDGNILTLSVDSAHKFQMDQLSKPDNKRFLEESLRGFFKQDIRLNLIPGEAARKPQNGNLQLNDPNELFKGAPDAKELFDSMGGEIIGQ
jgi:DNA polymerase III subunit gamma/tau